MRTPRFGRYTLTCCAAVVLLAGCNVVQPSDTQPPIAAPPAVSQTSSALLYVSDSATNSVSIFSYPQLKPAGKLTGIRRPGGLCADPRTGAVWVVSRLEPKIVEFAHGGTKRIRTLHAIAGSMSGCAVDASGNVAVAKYNDYDDPGELLIFKNGRGKPMYYFSSKMFFYSFVGYDAGGNAFVDGEPYAKLEELPAGGTKLENVTPRGLEFRGVGNVQFDGTDLAVGDQKRGLIYHISGRTITGTTKLNGSCLVGQFYIDTDSGVVIAPDACRRKGDVLIYDYPAGGAPIKRITGFRDPFGAVISR